MQWNGVTWVPMSGVSPEKAGPRLISKDKGGSKSKSPTSPSSSPSPPRTQGSGGGNRNLRAAVHLGGEDDGNRDNSQQYHQGQTIQPQPTSSQQSNWNKHKTRSQYVSYGQILKGYQDREKMQKQETTAIYDEVRPLGTRLDDIDRIRQAAPRLNKLAGNRSNIYSSAGSHSNTTNRSIGGSRSGIGSQSISNSMGMRVLRISNVTEDGVGGVTQQGGQQPTRDSVTFKFPPDSGQDSDITVQENRNTREGKQLKAHGVGSQSLAVPGNVPTTRQVSNARSTAGSDKSFDWRAAPRGEMNRDSTTTWRSSFRPTPSQVYQSSVFNPSLCRWPELEKHLVSHRAMFQRVFKMKRYIKDFDSSAGILANFSNFNYEVSHGIAPMSVEDQSPTASGPQRIPSKGIQSPKDNRVSTRSNDLIYNSNQGPTLGFFGGESFKDAEAALGTTAEQLNADLEYYGSSIDELLLSPSLDTDIDNDPFKGMALDCLSKALSLSLTTRDERRQVISRAVEQGRLSTVQLLMEPSSGNKLVRNAAPLWNARNRKYDTPLLIAIKDRELSMIRLLLSNWPTVSLDSKDILDVSCILYLIILRYEIGLGGLMGSTRIGGPGNSPMLDTSGHNSAANTRRGSRISNEGHNQQPRRTSNERRASNERRGSASGLSALQVPQKPVLVYEESEAGSNVRDDATSRQISGISGFTDMTHQNQPQIMVTGTKTDGFNSNPMTLKKSKEEESASGIEYIPNATGSQRLEATNMLLNLDIDADDIIDFMLDRADLSTSESQGWGVPHLSAYHGNLVFLQKLQARGYFDPESDQEDEEVKPKNIPGRSQSKGSTQSQQQRLNLNAGNKQRKKKSLETGVDLPMNSTELKPVQRLSQVLVSSLPGSENFASELIKRGGIDLQADPESGGVISLVRPFQGMSETDHDTGTDHNRSARDDEPPSPISMQQYSERSKSQIKAQQQEADTVTNLSNVTKPHEEPDEIDPFAAELNEVMANLGLPVNVNAPAGMRPPSSARDDSESPLKKRIIGGGSKLGGNAGPGNPQDGNGNAPPPLPGKDNSDVDVPKLPTATRGVTDESKTRTETDSLHKYDPSVIADGRTEAGANTDIEDEEVKRDSQLTHYDDELEDDSPSPNNGRFKQRYDSEKKISALARRNSARFNALSVQAREIVQKTRNVEMENRMAYLHMMYPELMRDEENKKYRGRPNYGIINEGSPSQGKKSPNYNMSDNGELSPLDPRSPKSQFSSQLSQSSPKVQMKLLDTLPLSLTMNSTRYTKANVYTNLTQKHIKSAMHHGRKLPKAQGGDYDQHAQLSKNTRANANHGNKSSKGKEEEENNEGGIPDHDAEVPLAPLHIGAGMGYLSVCTFLINQCNQHPAEVNPTNGSTPLIYACRGGHVEIVRLLLEYETVRQSVNHVDYTHNMSALHYAVLQQERPSSQDRLEICELLMASTRANGIGVKSAVGDYTPLDCARKRHLTGWLATDQLPATISKKIFNSDQSEIICELVDSILRCHVCRKKTKSIGLTCVRCGLVLYCSTDCQRTDWPKHKAVCLDSHRSKPGEKMAIQHNT